MALWHDDPALKGHFHPDYPDDLQILVHEGSFRFTETKPEIMWGHLLARMEWVGHDGAMTYAYKASLLNQPKQLKTLKIGEEILFIAYPTYRFPIRVTHDCLAIRSDYEITPCDKCGLPELFDPVPRLIDHTFPTMNDQSKAESKVIEFFTSFCPMCGGIMVVKRKDFPADKSEPPPPKQPESPSNPLRQLKKWLRK